MTEEEVRLCQNCLGGLKRYQGKYCSNTCQLAYQRAMYVYEWLNGDISGTAKYEVPTQIRWWLGLQKGEECWDCGWNTPHPLDGKPPLQVDHIDGDFANNRPENLRLLCPNHHALTETFGNRLGRKSSRSYRYPKVSTLQ